MKKTLFLTALLSILPHLHAAVGDTLDLTQGFVAEGVDATFASGVMTFEKTALQTSTRFFDSQKGWVAGSSDGDSYMCWAHTASNMIQYWQTYYGVFSKKDPVSIPYGSDYKRELYNKMNPYNSPVITDPMRLNVMKALKDSGFSNMGGEVATGTNWFFTWVDSQGGYYSEYFGEIHNGQSNYTGQTATITGINSLSTLKSALLPALGITENNGTYTQTESGLISHLNVTDGSNPHTLTCYGLTLNEDGSIKSLIIADSDDCRLRSTEEVIGSTGADGTYTPKLTQLYIQTAADGKLVLYSDESCETAFIDGHTYYVSGITQINTPEVLKNMLAEYSDTDKEALIWNGSKNATWKTVTSTTEQLPTEATGWDVLVNGDNIEAKHRGYYHSYAEDGRAVVFDTHGMNGSTETQVVTVTGTVTPGTITVKDEGNYHLQAGTGAAIAGSGDVSIESGGKLSSEINFGSRTITAQSGSHFAYAATADMTLNGQISGESGSTIQFRNESATSGISYSYTNWQLASNTVNSIKGTLVIGDRQDTMATHVDFSTAYNGYMNVENLVLNGASSLNTAGTTVVTGTFSSLKTLQDANTFNLRAATNTTATPIIHDSLDLTQAKALVMETAVSLDEYSYNETLKLSKTNRLALTLDPESFGISATPGEGFYVDLFTHVDSLTLGDNTTYTKGEWDAVDYFTSEYIDASTRLVLADGTVSLVGLTVPEPATATLSLLALASLAARRRRR